MLWQTPHSRSSSQNKTVFGKCTLSSPHPAPANKVYITLSCKQAVLGSELNWALNAIEEERRETTLEKKY